MSGLPHLHLPHPPADPRQGVGGGRQDRDRDEGDRHRDGAQPHSPTVYRDDQVRGAAKNMIFNGRAIKTVHGVRRKNELSDGQ